MGSNSLPNPVILGIINFLPLSGNVMIELASNLGFAIIDRMLGGQGEPLEKSREYSDIELSILEKIMVVCVRLLREPWRNVVELSPVLERVETNPQFAQIIAPTEMISIVTLNVKIGDVEGLMNVCLPFITLEAIMDKLNTKFWFSTMQNVMSAVDRGADEPGAPREQLCLGWSKALRVQSVVPLCLCGLT